VKVLLKLNLSDLYPTVTASAARQGGEQRKGNGRPAGNERDSAGCCGEPECSWRNPCPCGGM